MLSQYRIFFSRRCSVLLILHHVMVADFRFVSASRAPLTHCQDCGDAGTAQNWSYHAYRHVPIELVHSQEGGEGSVELHQELQHDCNAS